MWSLNPHKLTLPTPEQALPGRATPINSGELNALTGRPLKGPHPDHLARLVCAMGCFWGAERLFWQQEGVYATAVGYTGGYTPNPTYQEVCSGRTGHTEVVEVYFDPSIITLETLLTLFWERHDPTQGMRQGNDIGTQYRSTLYWSEEAQRAVIERSAERFQAQLESTPHHQAMSTQVTTELAPAPVFYYAEEEHQQYLYKHPDGYCGLRGTGVSCVF